MRARAAILVNDFPDLPPFLDRQQNGITTPARPPVAGKPLIFSYTFLNCYADICPYQAYRTYIKRDIPYEETPERKKGNDIHTAFEHRIGSGKPLPADMRHHEPIAAAFDGTGAKTELKVAVDRSGRACDYWDNGKAFIRGRLDCVVVKGTTAYLNDIKTGKVWEKPFELEVGAMLLHAQQPQLQTIVGTFTWLRENKLGKKYDLSGTAETWKKCNTIVSQIEADRASGHFEKREGRLCPYCSVLDCELNPRKP